MKLEKKINVHYQTNPLMEGEGFLFEVEKGDLPYGIFGKDCVEVARAVEGKAIPYRRREESGELVPANLDVRTELYNFLKDVGPTVGEDGSITFGGRSADDLLPRVTGIAVKDAVIAHQVAFLLKDRGYTLEKKFH